MGNARTVSESLCELDPALIMPNPAQPRKNFEDQELDSLAESIHHWGVLQPLTVSARKEDGRTFYELIAGERRLRAAIMAGLPRVPCRLMRVDQESSAEIAIVENLQRKELNPFEEASAIRVLLDRYGMTQEILAKRLSVSQSYIANKLRLMRLNENERERILRADLSERHARALLRIKEDKLRSSALDRIIAHAYNVAQTEEYIEHLLKSKETEKTPKRKVKGAIKDLRLFYNSLDRALGIMRGAGMHTNCHKRLTEDGVEVTILIKKKSK